MQSCMPNAQVLAQMGLELAEYERIIGNIYDSAIDTRCMNDALRELRALFKANFVTLILRVQDEPLLSPMMVAGDIELGEGGVYGHTIPNRAASPGHTLPRCDLAHAGAAAAGPD